MTNGKALARWCKAQIGTSYDVMDCIKLIVNGIRKADGADGESLSYTCGGTNELWRSINQSGKYRYVTEIVGIDEAKKRGMLVPGRLMVIWEPGHNEKYNDELGDCSHIGVYVGDADCEAVHSSYTRKLVATTTVKNGFTHVLSHRLIDLSESSTASEKPAATPAQPAQTDNAGSASGDGSVRQMSLIVTTEKDPLNVRDSPSIKGAVVGKAARGSTVTAIGAVQTVVEDGVSRNWVEISFKPMLRRKEQTGYACVDYLTGFEPAPSVREMSPVASSIDDVVVPRSVMLALADAANEADVFRDDTSVTAVRLRADAVNEAAVFLDNTSAAAVRLLLTAARDVTAYLEGDD